MCLFILQVTCWKEGDKIKLNFHVLLFFNPMQRLPYLIFHFPLSQFNLLSSISLSLNFNFYLPHLFNPYLSPHTLFQFELPNSNFSFPTFSFFYFLLSFNTTQILFNLTPQVFDLNLPFSTSLPIQFKFLFSTSFQHKLNFHFFHSFSVSFKLIYL